MCGGRSAPRSGPRWWFTGEAASPARAADGGEVIVDPDRTGPGRPLAVDRDAHHEEFRKETESMDEAVSMDELAGTLVSPAAEWDRGGANVARGGRS